MFLKSLIIQNDKEIIREIIFRKRINLIVDETTTIKTQSGNSVGKTTVLRLIDFCLDGDGKNIYTDSEFKTTNSKIEEFLKNNNIIITLTLIDDFESVQPIKTVIQRNFLKGKNKIQKINGENKKNGDFSSCLKEIIFKTTSEKPSFRQLISKNIRDEKNKLTQTIKVLDAYTTDAIYEALHLFWFGVDIDLDKNKLILEKNIEEKLQERLRKESNLPQITQYLIIINKEIERLNVEKASFNLNKNYEIQLKELNAVKSEINVVSSHVSHLKMRIELIEESRKDLEKNNANIDTQKIKMLYETARALIPNIQRTFEDTLKFHNDMIAQKINFITEELPELKKQVSEQYNILHSLLAKEKTLSIGLNKSNFMNDLEKIVLSLNNFHERKGALEEQKAFWEKTISNLEDIDKKLSMINDEINAKGELLQQRITEFNTYFSDISSRLEGIRSILSAEKINDVYKFSIGNIEGNPGTGGKKSQMASFDLSYIKFADEKNIPCLHFILQDQIENVHSNQITNLLTEIVSEINCQYVLPVLRDKLPSNINNIKEMEILSLSQQDKLFRI